MEQARRREVGYKAVEVEDKAKDKAAGCRAAVVRKSAVHTDCLGYGTDHLEHRGPRWEEGHHVQPDQAGDHCRGTGPEDQVEEHRGRLDREKVRRERKG